MIKCPVCYGKGTVPVGFYNKFESTVNCGEPTCKSCNGTGIVMEYQHNDTIEKLRTENEQLQKDVEKWKGLYEHRKTFSDKQQVDIEQLQAQLKEAVEIIQELLRIRKIIDLDYCIEKTEQFLSSCNVVPVEPKSEEVVKSCKTCNNNPIHACNDACAGCYSTEDKTGNTINNYSNWQPIEPKKVVTKEGI